MNKRSSIDSRLWHMDLLWWLNCNDEQKNAPRVQSTIGFWNEHKSFWSSRLNSNFDYDNAQVGFSRLSGILPETCR